MLQRIILIVAMLATALTLGACADSENGSHSDAAVTDKPEAVSVSEDVQDQVENVAEKLDDLKATTVTMAEEKLGDWKGKIDALNEKKDALNMTAQKLVEKPMEDLNGQYNNAVNLVDDIKDASSLDAVNEKKVEFMKSMDSVEGAYNKVTSLF